MQMQACADLASGRRQPERVRRPTGRRRVRGFTLIEMLVVIALIAIFVTVAVPSYHKMLQDNRIISALNSFAGTLAESRSEAVTRGVTVVVCPSSNATSTTPTCATTGTDWAGGWISFVPAAGSTSFSSGDTLLRQHGPVGGTITMGNIGSGTNGNYIAFDRMGFAQGTFAAGTSSLTVVACPTDGNVKQARAIVLGLSGSVRTATDTTGDGVVNGGNGTGGTGGDVTCP